VATVPGRQRLRSAGSNYTWWYQGTGLKRTDVALSSLLNRQLGMTCLMNCVTFLFLGLVLEIVLKLISFSYYYSAPSALEVFHYNALYKFMFTIYHLPFTLTLIFTLTLTLPVAKSFARMAP